MDEKGYTTFDLRWIRGQPPENALVTDLNYWRTRLFDEGLVGLESSGIGFGNVSVRIPGTSRFVISGTQTGGERTLAARRYSKVVDWCIQENRVVCVGEVAASSESLSHAAAYSAGSRVGSVIHVHSKVLWENLLGRVPTTARMAEAGTPEMAREIQRLMPVALTGARVIAMGGHRQGLLAVGASPASAVDALLSLSSHSV